MKKIDIEPQWVFSPQPMYIIGEKLGEIGSFNRPFENKQVLPGGVLA